MLPCYIVLAYVCPPIMNRLSSMQFAVQNRIAMHKMAMDSSFPVDKAAKGTTFTALAANFMFNNRVRDLFLNESMKN